MRIVYIVPAYPAMSQTFIQNEMSEVQAAGHEVIIIPLYSPPAGSTQDRCFRRLRPASILPSSLFSLKTVRFAMRMAFYHPIQVLRTLVQLHIAAGLNPYSHAGIVAVTPKALAIAWCFRCAEVNRIHAHFAGHTATCAGIAGKLSGLPFSFTAHAFDVYYTARRHRNDTLLWKLRHADHIFAVSEYLTDLLRQRMPAVADRIHKLYVGIPLDIFRAEPPPSRAEGLGLLCIARFDEKKGLDTLIKACGLLRDDGIRFHLRLYGGGPLHADLLKQVRSLRLADRVTIGGSVPRQEVVRQMRVCHVFVMPCRQAKSGDMDGIPTVFMEAMATGRPVISCGISGIPELVRHEETGLLVQPNDPRAVAMAVRRLAVDEELCLRLGRQARALVEKQHDQRVTARQFMNVIANT